MRNYRLIRSKRKTLCLQIRPDTGLEVRAPMKTPARIIDAFVLEKEAWIQKKLSQLEAVEKERQQFSLQSGEEITLLGIQYPIVSGTTAVFDGSCFFLPDDLAEKERREMLASLYRSMARHWIPDRVALWSKRTGWRCESVGITSASRRWGSCSGTNRLNFSWKLLFATEDAVDYVIVHELAHTIHHDHSPAFWRMVESVLPDYRERKKQLREAQHRIVLEGWE